jgi:SsrA-binding protein
MSTNINIKNKKARFEFILHETFTAGMQLTGTEIKSIRNGKATITESYCVLVDGEVFIRNMNIAEYDNASYNNHNPRRDRKLLLNRKEIDKLEKKATLKGFSIVPLKVFMSGKGLAKIDIALGEGKKLHDKRETMKERDSKRDLDRVKKQYG